MLIVLDLLGRTFMLSRWERCTP